MSDKRTASEIAEDEAFAEAMEFNRENNQAKQIADYGKSNKFRFQALDELANKGKVPSLEHIGQDDADRLGLPWKEKDYNYRINPDYSTHYITDKNNNTLGHFALDEDGVTRSVYIDPQHRGQGLAYKAHEALASKLPIQMDDANEPEIYKIWDKLKANYGDKIEQIGKTVEGRPRYRFKELLQNVGNGTFKALPIIGPLIGAGMAAISGEANAASAFPILGEADSLGPSMEDSTIENPQANPNLRKEALKKLAGK